MRKLVFALALVLVIRVGNVFGQDNTNNPTSDQENPFAITARFGFILTEYYSLQEDFSPSFSLGFGRDNLSLVFGFNTGKDLFTFSYGAEKKFFDGNAFAGFGVVLGKADNYRGTGQRYSFSVPYGTFGVNILKGFYVGTKVGIAQEYMDFHFGLQLKEVF